MSTVYHIQKHIEKPVVFKGFSGQYIWWLGIGLTICLLLFALLYLVGLPMLICVSIVFVLAGIWIWYVATRSKQYGEHGMMKKMAAGAVPKWVKA